MVWPMTTGRREAHTFVWSGPPRPSELPEVEYQRLGLQPLWTGGPGEPREVVGTPSFLEEVLRVALEHGFRLDSVFPDPEDLLNSRSLRFVRH